MGEVKLRMKCGGAWRDLDTTLVGRTFPIRLDLLRQDQLMVSLLFAQITDTLLRDLSHWL